MRKDEMLLTDESQKGDSGSLSSRTSGYVSWINIEACMPKEEVVVLINIRALGEHGVVSAWWCEEDYRWIALDDAQQYEQDEVDYWCPMINLPVT